MPAIGCGETTSDGTGRRQQPAFCCGKTTSDGAGRRLTAGSPLRQNCQRRRRSPANSRLSVRQAALWF
jgi:hypothetical protein